MALHGNRPWFKGLSKRGHLTEIWVNHETNEFVAFVVFVCMYAAHAMSSESGQLRRARRPRWPSTTPQWPTSHHRLDITLEYSQEIFKTWARMRQ